MANNVFEQTVDREIFISSNQIACTIIEHLLPYANAENLERFQNAFAASFRPICSDKFASHILEKMVEVSFLRAVASIQPQCDAKQTSPTANKKRKLPTEIPNEKQYNLTSTEFDADHQQKCTDFVEKISKFLLNNLEDFVFDAYGCHVMRTCILSLSGLFVFKRNDYVMTSEQRDVRNLLPADKEIPLRVHDNWIEIIREYADRLQQWPHFDAFPYDELSSGLLQNLCLALRHLGRTDLKHFGKRILTSGFLAPIQPDDKKDDDHDMTIDKLQLPKVFTSACAIRLLETMLCAGGRKLFTQLYAMLFVGRLAVLSESRTANFAVQKLLDNVKEKADFEAMFDELSPHIEALLRIGYTGVVNALCQTCLRLCSKQGAFIQGLQSALHCASPPDRMSQFAMLTIRLKPYEVATAEKSIFVHLHGSLILQAMLQFNKPIRLVQCLMEMQPSELAEIFNSPKGSHVADAFLQSKTIGEKSREKFIRHLDGYYLEMAMAKHGSRAVEQLFAAAADNQKVRIVKELAEKMNQLNCTPTGRLLNYKFRVDTYRLSPAQWKAAFGKEVKAEKLFKDIL